ncbi:hypothetical protein [uncultured Helicobacter sp.]|uniref:hypothetical protein n=1 Tax=uncultured Helicobacter sp. TaxID=175537 RepID=UPI00374E5290
MVFGKHSVDSGGAFAFLFLILVFIVGVVFLISQIFVVMGVYKIREVKVLNLNFEQLFDSFCANTTDSQKTKR